MVGLPCRTVHRGHRNGLAAVRGDSIQRRVYPVGRPKQNASVGVPSCASRRLYFAQDLKIATVGFNSLQIAGGKKANRVTIGRPEWLSGILRSGQFTGGSRLQPLKPKTGLAV